jgi:UMF1 family MFS transporter
MTSAQIAWIIYDLANSAYALIVRTVFAPLYIKFCADGVISSGDSTSYWGMIASISGIVAGALSIWLGHFCDNRTCRKKVLAFFVASGILSTWGFALCGKGDVYPVLAMAFVSLGCYLCANSLYDSLLISISEPEQRDKLSVMSYALGYIGGVIPFIGCLVTMFVMEDKNLATRIAFAVAGVWWLLLSLPLFFKVREKQAFPEKRNSFRQDALEVWRNRNVRLFLIAYFLYIDGVGTIYLMATPIAVDIGISETALMATILGLQFYAFPCTLLYGKLAGRFGAVSMIKFAIGCYIVASVAVGTLAFVESATAKLVLFILLAMIIGSSQGGIQSLSRSLYSRIIPPEKAAQYFGFYNLFGKFTTIVGPVMVFIAVKLAGYSEFGILAMAIPFFLGGRLLTKVVFPGEK